MSFNAQIRQDNEEWLAQLENPGMAKHAEDTATAFIRTRAREDGAWRQIQAMETVTNADLDRQVDTDSPSIVIDKEPESPAAVSVPFGKLPIGFYIQGPRCRATFRRLLSTRFLKDVEELRDWEMDIRQVLSDNSVKDVMAEEDRAWFTAVNTALLGPDVVIPYAGIAQWQTIFGGITIDTLQEALSIMPRTPSHVETSRIVTNNVTIRQVMKLNYSEAGEIAVNFLRNGWAETRLLDKDWLITNKRHLVPDNSMYMFGDNRFIGKSYSLTELTMFVKREGYLLEFFCYETIGGVIGHTGALARADFA